LTYAIANKKLPNISVKQSFLFLGNNSDFEVVLSDLSILSCGSYSKSNGIDNTLYGLTVLELFSNILDRITTLNGNNYTCTE